MDAPRTIWLIWDGASFPVVQSLLEQQQLPNLSRLLRRTSLSMCVPPAPNCETASSMASLLTGTAPEHHGIWGCEMPRPLRPGILEKTSGFRRALLKQPPVWETLAAAGVQSALAHVPWTDGLSDGLGVEVGVDAYERCLFPAGVIEGGELAVGREITVPVRVGNANDQHVISIGNTTLAVPDGPPGTISWAAAPVPVAPSVLTWVGVAVTEQGARVLVSGAFEQRVFGQRADLASHLLDQPFVGSGLGRSYRRGALGPQASGGGNGTAERLYQASLRLLATSFTRLSVEMLRLTREARLLVAYQPVIDEAQHELFRALPKPWSRPEAVSPEGATLRVAYRLADEHLGALMAAAPDDHFVVCSDHGCAPLHTNVHLNTWLEAHQLLRFDKTGQVDPAGSQAFYHPARNGSVWVNPWWGGAELSDEEQQATRARVETLLRDLRDEAGNPIIQEVCERRTEAGLCSFVVARSGYELVAAPGPGVLAPATKRGTHVTRANTLSLHGILAVRSRVGRRPVRSILRNQDVAEIVHDLLEVA